MAEASELAALRAICADGATQIANLMAENARLAAVVTAARAWFHCGSWECPCAGEDTSCTARLSNVVASYEQPQPESEATTMDLRSRLVAAEVSSHTMVGCCGPDAAAGADLAVAVVADWLREHRAQLAGVHADAGEFLDDMIGDLVGSAARYRSQWYAYPGHAEQSGRQHHAAKHGGGPT